MVVFPCTHVLCRNSDLFLVINTTSNVAQDRISLQQDSSTSPVAEFKRLCKEYEKDARHEFDAAIEKEFHDLYRTNEKDINN